MLNDNQKVFVLLQNGHAVNTNIPKEVLINNNSFDCPNNNCEGIVPITYWKDGMGVQHPNFGLRCTKCGCSYYILK